MLNNLCCLSRKKFETGQYKKETFKIFQAGIATGLYVEIEDSIIENRVKPIKQDHILAERIVDFLLYAWAETHDCLTRFTDIYEYVYIPDGIDYDGMRSVSFKELLYFISPQTKKTSE